jgi:hypothetical protein
MVGGQHKKNVARFKSQASTQQAIDCDKTATALANGVSVVRIDQKDVWYDRYAWRTLLPAALAFALQKALDGTPVCVTLCRDEADLSYAPFLALVLATPHAHRAYEMFLPPNEHRLATCIHHATHGRAHALGGARRLHARPLRHAERAAAARCCASGRSGA